MSCNIHTFEVAIRILKGQRKYILISKLFGFPDAWPLDSFKYYPTHNSLKNIICTNTRTPNAQARVWQLATATSLCCRINATLLTQD